MSPECQHCGAHVSERYARVYGDEDGVVHRCLHCESPQFLMAGSSAGREVDIADSIRDRYHSLVGVTADE